MREYLRGYAAAVLGQARAEGRAEAVLGELSTFAQAVFDNQELFDVLSDDAVPVASRRSIVEDLLAGAQPATRRLVSQAVATESGGELPPAAEWLVGRAQDEVEAAQAGQAGPGPPQRPPAGPPPDPPTSRDATRERLDGFSAALFESTSQRAEVEEVEDELFRFTRTVEASEPLRSALTDPSMPVAGRQALVVDLLGAKARPTTTQLVSYAVGAARGRGLVGLLDWLVERTAAERGLRVADVRAAVELDEGQRGRLSSALSKMTGRQVELRVTVDPSLLGGVMVLVGDTVMDGTVRHRLDQLRVGLASARSGPDAGPAPAAGATPDPGATQTADPAPPPRSHPPPQDPRGN